MRSTTIGLLLLVVLFGDVDSVHTRLIFTGSLYCRFDWAREYDFVFDIKVGEYDSYFGNYFDDDIGINGTLVLNRVYPDEDDPRKATKSKQFHYRMEAEDDGDGYINLDGKYENFLNILHNCTENGEKEWVVKDTHHHAVMDGTKQIKTNFDVGWTDKESFPSRQPIY